MSDRRCRHPLIQVHPEMRTSGSRHQPFLRLGGCCLLHHKPVRLLLPSPSTSIPEVTYQIVQTMGTFLLPGMISFCASSRIFSLSSGSAQREADKARTTSDENSLSRNHAQNSPIASATEQIAPSLMQEWSDDLQHSSNIDLSGKLSVCS